MGGMDGTLLAGSLEECPEQSRVVLGARSVRAAALFCRRRWARCCYGLRQAGPAGEWIGYLSREGVCCWQMLLPEPPAPSSRDRGCLDNPNKGPKHEPLASDTPRELNQDPRDMAAVRRGCPPRAVVTPPFDRRMCAPPDRRLTTTCHARRRSRSSSRTCTATMRSRPT